MFAITMAFQRLVTAVLHIVLMHVSEDEGAVANLVHL